MLYLLLIALMALPLAGTALALIAEQVKPVRGLAEPLYLVPVAAALLLGLALRPAQIELIFGDWSPVSFTGTPLILAANPGGISILIAIVAVMLLSPFTARSAVGVGGSANENRARPLIAGALFIALCITVLAYDMVTLLIGISLVDMAVALNGLVQSRHAGRVLRDAFFHAASIGLLVIAIALYNVTGNSLYLPLAQIPERLMPFFSTALALRLCLTPLRAASDLVTARSAVGNDNDWVDKASPAASLLLLSRLPQLGAPELHAWFFAFALLTAISALALGALTARSPSGTVNRSRLQTSLSVGGLAIAVLSAVTWNSGIITASAIAWILGVSLVEFNTSSFGPQLRRVILIPRLVGLLCIVGLPLTVGFIGRSGTITTWAERGLGGAALIVGFALAQVLLTVCALRLLRWSDTPATHQRPITEVIRAIMLLAPVVLIVLYGLSPNLAGAPSFSSQLSHNGLLGWFLWLITTIVGVAVWFTEGVWSKLIETSRERISSVIGLGWWQDIMTGAIDRLSKPLHGVITFLDSDGALLWAIIVILIVVLVSRPGGP